LNEASRRLVERAPFVFLDFDGTLVDTESAVRDAWRDVYDELGVTFDPVAWCALVGGDGADPVGELRATLGDLVEKVDPERMFHDRVAVRLAQEPLRRGLAEALGAWAARGAAVTVVSSSPRAWVRLHLDRLGIAHRFDAVVTREDAARAKPAPDLYLEAIRRTGALPHVSLAIEDSSNGVLAATAAGLACLAVPNDATSGHDFAGALDTVTMHEIAAATRADACRA
jgi:HAD superfamily hydrolase (TIGR01509 family)